LGGASYLVPTEIKPKENSFKFKLDYRRRHVTDPNKEYHTFIDKLYTEIKEAAQNQGQAVSKKTAD
jgi:ribosomal protein S7